MTPVEIRETLGDIRVRVVEIQVRVVDIWVRVVDIRSILVWKWVTAGPSTTDGYSSEVGDEDLGGTNTKAN